MDEETFFYEILLVAAVFVALVIFVAVMTVLTSKRKDQVVNVNFEAEKTREANERFVGKARGR